MEYRHVVHEFPPLYDESSEILILGSMPSPKSREQGFYYGHPANRFWRVMAAVLGAPFPETVEERKALMLSNHIALWDSLIECDIAGASDSSIKNPVPSDIPRLIGRTRIARIYTTGNVAHRFYKRYNYPKTGIEAVKLPSTSPANCAVSLERLIEAYSVIRQG